MFDWFSVAPTVAHGKESIPLYTYVKEQLGLELQKVVDYYHSRPTNVASQHILVRLLLNLNVSMDRDNYDYVATVSDVGIASAGQLGITTAISQGRVHSPGWFYGKKTDEIIVLHDTGFDIDMAYAQWRTLRSVTVLRHPFSDMSLQRCTANYQTTEPRGISVIAINLPMLALQYKAWSANEALKPTDRATLQQFISMYVITNMLYSHTDVAFFNRLSNRFFKEDSGEFVRVHPVFNVDYTAMLDTCLTKMLQIHTRRALLWDALMEQLEPITTNTLREALTLPDVIPTRQIKWALLVARLPLIHWLVRFTHDNHNTRNQHYLRRLKSQLHAIRVDRVLDQALPQSVLMDIDKTLMTDINPYL